VNNCSVEFILKEVIKMEKLMKKSKSGFTLVELVIVIAILAIVAAIAIPTAANVIGNANKAADASNAQAIEMAIKTCQAEGIAENTNNSTTFEKVKNEYGQATNPKKKVVDLLADYGVSSTVLTTKQSGYSFYYDASSGKVTVATSATGQTQLTADTTFTLDKDTNTISIP
jgi:prepilin-type N-terminal cleavage/methylation domain-containing protein